MVPQLDTAFYISQLFWLVVCLLVLVFAFKKFFLPKISNLTISRERYINDLKSEVQMLEQQIDGLISELESIKRKQGIEINNLNKQAKEQCLQIFEKQKEEMEIQHIKNLSKMQCDADDTIKNLSKTLNVQIEKAVIEVFNKLFT